MNQESLESATPRIRKAHIITDSRTATVHSWIETLVTARASTAVPADGDAYAKQFLKRINKAYGRNLSSSLFELNAEISSAIVIYGGECPPFREPKYAVEKVLECFGLSLAALSSHAPLNSRLGHEAQLMLATSETGITLVKATVSACTGLDITPAHQSGFRIRSAHCSNFVIDVAPMPGYDVTPQRSALSKLKVRPPKGYKNWIDYIVENIDKCELYPSFLIEFKSETSFDHTLVRDAVQFELRELQQASSEYHP